MSVGSLSILLARARPLFETRVKDETPGPCVLFFSVTDGVARAQVSRGAGSTFQQAWINGVSLCQSQAQRRNMSVRWLRIDRVTHIDASTVGELATRLSKTKRCYFRHGVALDPDLEFAFLEQEVNANAMLYQGSAAPHAGINEKNFGVYAKRRYGSDISVDFSPDRPIYVFSHEGLFLAQDEALPSLPGSDSPVWLPGPTDAATRWRDASCLNAGRRQVRRMTPEFVYALIDSSANFLARQVKPNGQFVYGHFPCFGREIPAYNSLRHASSVYSMLEAWELTRNDALLHAIRKALAYLTETLVRRYPQSDGSTLAYNVDSQDEIKLGANAVSLLALVKYDELTGDTAHRPLLESLALGIARMQCPNTGRFVHVLNAGDLSVKEAFRIVYYDGEAAFGLMRLYGLTLDPRWLTMAERAFDYFIDAEHWKHHDHWLSYCANELTLHKPAEKYFRFGVQNIEGHLDFILQRETTYPTLLELSMAFEAMLRRIQAGHPEMRHVLDGLDIEKFRRALHHRAHYLLNGLFWPELAMYFAKPSSIVGSFFIRHHTFRVRIDDVEHYLSGYVSYWKMLSNQQVAATKREATAFPPAQRPFQANWNAPMLARAVKGHWLSAVPASWRATGVAPSRSAYLPGNVAIARGPDRNQAVGISADALAALPYVPQAIIIEESDVNSVKQAFVGPALVVPDMPRALLDLGRYSRERMTGMVLAVTGSAGKTTTCAMLAQMLRAWGPVSEARLSANTSRGIAWNLASMPWNSRYSVVEMAIAGMARSSAMTRPHLAIVTNIGPAHLQYHQSTENIALLKSKIFSGMSEGGHAIINADTLHVDVIVGAAEDSGLNVITYGEHPAASIRMVRYDDATGDGVIETNRNSFQFSGSSRHIAFNTLACVAVAQVLELDITHAVRQLGLFQPLSGRGARFTLHANGRQIRVIDESYNANPLSMAAAIKDFCRVSAPGKGILLLGEMLELHDQARALHRSLVPLILDARPRAVVLLGECMRDVAALLKENIPSVHWHESASEAWAEAIRLLPDDEVVLVKGSNGTGLYGLLRKLEAISPT